MQSQNYTHSIHLFSGLNFSQIKWGFYWRRDEVRSCICHSVDLNPNTLVVSHWNVSTETNATTPTKVSSLRQGDFHQFSMIHLMDSIRRIYFYKFLMTQINIFLSIFNNSSCVMIWSFQPTQPIRQWSLKYLKSQVQLPLPETSDAEPNFNLVPGLYDFWCQPSRRR